MVKNNKQFERIQQSLIVPNALSGKRLDQILAELFNEYSRAMLQRWLKDGNILVDGKVLKAKTKLIGQEEITLDVAIQSHNEHWQPQALDLDIIYEDEHLLVINKPVGLVVHPGAGNPSNTLSNALLAYNSNFSLIPRAGIVHRLDKDTSGLMVCAKTLKAHTSLVEQLQNRSVKRQYEAITCGIITAGSTITTHIGRNPHNRLKMAVVREGGKLAITHFNVIEHYRDHTRIRCQLETGRTHQIRVHLLHLKHPLLGDPLYNPRLKLAKGITDELSGYLKSFKRQALHAYHLAFLHPETKQIIEFKQAPPKDMLTLTQLLRSDMSHLKEMCNLYEDDYYYDDEHYNDDLD
ncbi:23S rRNA pseudouridine(1911/1915/1917) synthase RluD [Thiotrichales bacterium 19S3-7]|nr:23S rRNA pseudouridine(1911/1915/1917) synthase RluD [Thiotrichales bacterium 19S3-7]MCF6801176.1 23S rRNA pseudouridine(1911/1915/1917) synthase RluD [Thiotrichales bacterium 19S3-11]